LRISTHPSELGKPTNTGRLVADCFRGSRVDRWHPFEPPEGWVPARRYLVFPDDHPDLARRATEGFPGTGANRGSGEDPRLGTAAEIGASGPERPLELVLLDGTWAQARRMARKTRWLAGLPVVSLPREERSRYELRRSVFPHHLCTAEAVIRLVRRAGLDREAELFELYFRLFLLQYRYVRTGPGSGEGEVPERDRLRGRLAAARS
jgi:DTW domain-containing protein YfiP